LPQKTPLDLICPFSTQNIIYKHPCSSITTALNRDNMGTIRKRKPKVEFISSVCAFLLCCCLPQQSAGEVVAVIIHNSTADETGVWSLVGDDDYVFEFFGTNNTFSLTDNTTISLTSSELYCDDNSVVEREIVNVIDSTHANVTLTIPDILEDTIFYFCVDNVHQGNAKYKTLAVTVKPVVVPSGLDVLPLWFQLIIVLILLFLSGTFSGLNLGLMALDIKELDILQQAGSSPKADERQKQNGEYARKIYPLRKRGNMLLCTVLLGNVLVNSSLTIFLDYLFATFPGGTIVGLIVSTFGIVIFGEIIPQAICSRRGLVVGAKAVPLVYVFMVLTFIVAYPLSRILDVVLGEEVGSVFNKAELLQMLKITDADNDLAPEELAIVTGALTYREKLVKEVMTSLSDVYKLSIDTILDFKKMNEIFQKGHSRIPVYENHENNIVGILYMKELVFVDPDDRTSLKTIVNFYKHSLITIEDDVQLDVLLSKFIRQRSHLILVQRVCDPDDGKDRYFELVGIVTLEDVIEEIIGSEINDEDDEVLDNKTKFKIGSSKNQMTRLFPQEIEGDELSAMLISDQMAMAAITFLAGNVERYFGLDLLPRNTLGLLVHKAESCRIYNDEDDESDEDSIVYIPGQPLDKLCLVLEGKVKMTIGKDDFCFDQGPFSIIGKNALDNLDGAPGIADFTAIVPKGVRTTIIQISRKVYKAALVQGKLHMSTPILERRNTRNIIGPSQASTPYDHTLPTKITQVTEIEVDSTTTNTNTTADQPDNSEADTLVLENDDGAARTSSVTL